MAFFANAVAEADKLKVEFTTEAVHEREERVLAVLKEAGEKLSAELGGHLVLTATGHINEDPGSVGDNLNLQISSTIAPGLPVQDVGAEAALGSTKANPPEASTAAPPNTDGSTPTPQPPVPQPDVS